MFGAEVEDVLFVFVVLFVGVEGVYANSFYVRQVVDFDAFAVERVEAVVDGGFVAVGMLCGQFGEGGDPGAETRLSFSANKVDLESIFYFTELDRCGGVEDDAIGGQGFDELVLGKGLGQGERVTVAACRVWREGAARRVGGGAELSLPPGVDVGVGSGGPVGGPGEGSGVVGVAPASPGGRVRWLGCGGGGPGNGQQEGEQAEGQDVSVFPRAGCSNHETVFSNH